jgi:hypothetical protein
MVTDMAAGGAYHKDGGIFIVIAGERSNLKSFWSGKFQSQWNVTVDGSTARLSGESKIHVHYFEDGNLQMQTSKSFPAETLNWKNEVELADAIFTRIQVFWSEGSYCYMRHLLDYFTRHSKTLYKTGWMTCTRI